MSTEHRNPIKINAEALSKASSDRLEITPDPIWSRMRSGRAGRTIHCYGAVNLTKGTRYDVEVFLDDEGEPWGWCSCPATVICKHIIACAKKLALVVIETKE